MSGVLPAQPGGSCEVSGMCDSAAAQRKHGRHGCSLNSMLAVAPIAEHTCGKTSSSTCLLRRVKEKICPRHSQ